MSDNRQTVMQRLDETFGCYPIFPITYYNENGGLKSRVAKHDLIHLLTIERQWPLRITTKDEYAAGIVQATLQREAQVLSRDVSPAHDDKWREPLTKEDIKRKVLPAIPKFVETMLTLRGLPTPESYPIPFDQYIERHYKTALEFDRLFEEKYGRPFYQTPSEEIVALEFQPLKELYRQAVLKVRIMPGDGSLKETSTVRQ